MRGMKRALWVALVVCAAAGCSRKQEAGPLPIAGETPKAGAKLAYEHRLQIELADGQLAARMDAVRQACETARFGACNVLTIEQGAHDGSLSLRVVPSGVEPLSQLASQDGRLTARQTGAEDLAEAINDNEGKLKQLDAYAAQLEQIAQRKDIAVADLIALSHERAQIEVQRDELKNIAAQQQRRIDTNVLTMQFVDSTVSSRGHRMSMTFSGWLDRLGEGVSDALSVLAYGLPFLLLAFPLALLWRWLWRRLVRSRAPR